MSVGHARRKTAVIFTKNVYSKLFMCKAALIARLPGVGDFSPIKYGLFGSIIGLAILRKQFDCFYKSKVRAAPFVYSLEKKLNRLLFNH